MCRLYIEMVYTYLSYRSMYSLYTSLLDVWSIHIFRVCLRILYTHRSSMYGLYISFLYVNVKSIHLSLLRLVFTYRSSMCIVYILYTYLSCRSMYSLYISLLYHAHLSCPVDTYLESRKFHELYESSNRYTQRVIQIPWLSMHVFLVCTC